MPNVKSKVSLLLPPTPHTREHSVPHPSCDMCHGCASRLVVGAPLEVVGANQTGRLYDCDAASGLCQPISLHSE